MKQFDVFENPSSASRTFAPYLALLSSHHLADLEDVIVAPLVNDAHRTIDVLEIEVSIEGRALVLVITELFSLTARKLGRRVGSISEHEDAIRRGLDRLFTGF